MRQRKFWHKLKIKLFNAYWILSLFENVPMNKVKTIVFLLELRNLNLFNLSRGSFEEISLIQSCRELNDVSFENLKMRIN